MLRHAKMLRNNWGTRSQMIRGALGPAVLMLFVGLLAGCPKKPDVGQAGPAAVGPQAPVTTPAPAAPAAKAPETPVSRPAAPREAALPPLVAPRTASESPMSPLKDVFFDFDNAAIRDDQKAALAADAAWLKANPKVKLLVEGHCDERGTAEYNLGLGERRAKAVRDFLVAAGVEASRVRTVSYGKERPFVLGHDESAWKLNRRGHLVQE